MKKKINKTKILKEQIKMLSEKLNEALSDVRYYKKITENIQDVLNMDSAYGNRATTDKLLIKVQELYLFKRQQEGLCHPLRDVVDSQREIIRWLIKPSTADNSKELQNLKKGLNIY